MTKPNKESDKRSSTNPTQRIQRTHAMPLDALDGEKSPIPDVYKAIDNDLARDNLENDLPSGDLQDI